jgi:hypothetical protein
MITEQQVKTQDFSEAEARKLTIRALMDGELPLEDRLALVGPVLLALNGEIIRLRLRLAEQEQIGALNTGTLDSLKALVDAIRQQVPGPIYVPPARDLPAGGGSQASYAVGAGPRRILKGAVPS